MDISVRTVEQVTVVQLAGELDATTSLAAQQRILPLIQPGGGIVLDMTSVAYMSSAGLRMLLSMHRRVAEIGGRVVLTGLSDELRETMNVTGFLTFFVVDDDLDAAVRKAAGERDNASEGVPRIPNVG